MFYGKGVILSLMAVCGGLMAAFGFPPEIEVRVGLEGFLRLCVPEREGERERCMDRSRYRTCRQIEKVCVNIE